MKVKVLEWHAFSTWHWNINQIEGQESENKNSNIDELCGICRVPFDGTCPNCKYPGDECPIVLGSGCTHNFHLHCILQWLEQEPSKGLCPMCRQAFTFVKEFTIQSEELDNLQSLIDGHKALKESQVGNEGEYEAFE